MKIKPSTKYHGVYLINDKWMIQLSINKKKYTYGPYPSELDASYAYDDHKKRMNPKSRLINHSYPSTGRVNVKKHSKTQIKIKTIRQTQKSTPKQKSILSRGQSSPIRRKFPEFITKRICHNQKWTCIICQTLLDEHYEIDHILPLSLEGADDISNLQALCNSCHHFKSCRVDHILRSIQKSDYVITPAMILTIQKKEFDRWYDLSNNPAGKWIEESDKVKESDCFVPIAEHIVIKNQEYLCIPVAQLKKKDTFAIPTPIIDMNQSMYTNSSTGATSDTDSNHTEIEIIIEADDDDNDDDHKKQHITPQLIFASMLNL